MATSKIDMFRSRVSAGYSRLERSTVCICALARDCAPALERNLPWLDELCARIGTARVVIVENDSKDDTKVLLRSWAAERPHVTLLLNDFGTVTVPSAEQTSAHPSYSKYRISKMAAYRNQYLDFASELGGLEYVIVVDLDLYWIDIDGIANAFGQQIPWDAQFANGRISDPWRPRLGDFYWDTYALWELGDSTPQTEDKLLSYGEMLQSLTWGMPLFAVQSAFGGLGVYRWAALRGHRYGLETNQGDPRIEVIVEHAYLHRRLIEAGHTRLFINPSMIVHYDRGPRSRAVLITERLAHVVRHRGVFGAARRLLLRAVAAWQPDTGT